MKLFYALLAPLTLGTLCFASEPLVAPKPENASPTTYSLGYRFAVDEIYRYELNEKSEVTDTNAQFRQIARNDSSLEKHYRVIETYSDGSAKLELVIDRVRLRMKVATPEHIDDPKVQPIQYDTASSQEPPEQLAALKRGVGKPVAIATVSPSGRLLAMEDRVTATQANKQNEERHNFLAILPEQPVAIGESWGHSYEVPLEVGPKRKLMFKLIYSYTLDQVEGEIATISFTTAVMPRLTDPVLRARFAQQLPVGTIQFDRERGVIVSQTQRVDRTELGVAGPQSSLTVVSDRVERLVDPSKKVSQAR